MCELRTSPGALEQDWDGLVAHVAEQRSEVVVLPEMGFAPWFAEERLGSDAAWASSVTAHAAWSERLPELGAVVIGTRPVDRPAGRRNEAYVAAPTGALRVGLMRRDGHQHRKPRRPMRARRFRPSARPAAAERQERA